MVKANGVKRTQKCTVPPRNQPLWGNVPPATNSRIQPPQNKGHVSILPGPVIYHCSVLQPGKLVLATGSSSTEMLFLIEHPLPAHVFSLVFPWLPLASFPLPALLLPFCYPHNLPRHKRWGSSDVLEEESCQASNSGDACSARCYKWAFKAVPAPYN